MVKHFFISKLCFFMIECGAEREILKTDASVYQFTFFDAINFFLALNPSFHKYNVVRSAFNFDLLKYLL